MPLPAADGRGPGSGRQPSRVRLQTRFLLYFTSVVVAVMAFTILLDSQVRRGTTFTVSLPVDATAPAERAAGAASPAARPAS